MIRIALIALAVAGGAALILAGILIPLITWSLIMAKLDDIIAELKADREALKAARLADAQKSDELAAQLAAVKEQLANVASPEQLAELQTIADDLKALGTAPVVPAAAPPEPPAA